MKFHRKFKDYLILILIILLIILISLYYQNSYPNEEYLQNNSIQQTLISGVTSVFNGYTETLTVQAGYIGNNLFSNIGIIILLFLLFGIVEYLLGNTKDITKLLFMMLIVQFAFVPIWWYTHPVFKGGLSLWGTFLLFTIGAELYIHSSKRLKMKHKPRAHIYLFSIFFIAFLYLFYISVTINLTFIILSFVFLIFVPVILRSIRKIYTWEDLIAPLAASVFISFLLVLYVLPVENSSIRYFNPHVFALFLFFTSFYLFKKGLPKCRITPHNH